MREAGTDGGGESPRPSSLRDDYCSVNDQLTPRVVRLPAAPSFGREIVSRSPALTETVLDEVHVVPVLVGVVSHVSVESAPATRTVTLKK